jgi:hypothetical protein
LPKGSLKYPTKENLLLKACQEALCCEDKIFIFRVEGFTLLNTSKLGGKKGK